MERKGINKLRSGKFWKLKFYLISCLIISIILSLFDWHPDWNFWKLEIARNFVLSFSVGGLGFLFGQLFKFKSVSAVWLRNILNLMMWLVGAWLGTAIGWLLNDWLFKFNVTHPLLFFTYTSVIILVIFIIIQGYEILRSEIKRMALKLGEQEIAEQKLIQLKTRAELEALRSKVNPHFFFNTLNSIASLIPIDPTKAEKLTEQFSSLFRYPFTIGEDQMVPLSKEIAFIQDYLEIEKVRLGKRLDYTISFDDSLADYPIPAMLIQPLVENSIIHGIAPKSEGGKISVKCVRENANCKIEVTDNGPGINPLNQNSGFGLSGVTARLDLIYSSSHNFSIQNNNGVSIKILLPLNKT